MEGPTAALCERSRSFLRFYPVITLDRLILEALHRKPYQTTQELAVRLGRSSKRVSGRLRWLEDRRAVRTWALVNGFFTWTLSEKMQRRQISKEIAQNYEKAVVNFCMERNGIGRGRA